MIRPSSTDATSFLEARRFGQRVKSWVFVIPSLSATFLRLRLSPSHVVGIVWYINGQLRMCSTRFVPGRAVLPFAALPGYASVGGRPGSGRLSVSADEREMPMCGFVCLWQVDDPPLARRMIGKIAHRGPDGSRSGYPRRARGDGALPPRDYRSREWNQPIHGDDDALVAMARSTTMPIFERFSARTRSKPAATARPSCTFPFARAAVDFQVGRNVRVRSHNTEARRRGARSAWDQAALQGESRRRTRLRIGVEGIRRHSVDDVEEIAPGVMYDSVDGPRRCTACRKARRRCFPAKTPNRCGGSCGSCSKRRCASGWSPMSKSAVFSPAFWIPLSRRARRACGAVT